MNEFAISGAILILSLISAVVLARNIRRHRASAVEIALQPAGNGSLASFSKDPVLTLRIRTGKEAILFEPTKLVVSDESDRPVKYHVLFIERNRSVLPAASQTDIDLCYTPNDGMKTLKIQLPYSSNHRPASSMLHCSR